MCAYRGGHRQTGGMGSHPPAQVDQLDLCKQVLKLIHLLEPNKIAATWRTYNLLIYSRLSCYIDVHSLIVSFLTHVAKKLSRLRSSRSGLSSPSSIASSSNVLNLKPYLFFFAPPSLCSFDRQTYRKLRLESSSRLLSCRVRSQRLP